MGISYLLMEFISNCSSSIISWPAAAGCQQGDASVRGPRDLGVRLDRQYRSDTQCTGIPLVVK